MRAHHVPQLYRRPKRTGPWWCYWQDERWSTRTHDRAEAERRVAARYGPAGLPPAEKGLGDALALLHEALVRRGRSKSTRGMAVQKTGHYVRLWGIDKPLRDIDYPLLSEYIRTRLEVDRVKRLTVSSELGYFRQAWKLARASGWAPRAWDELMPERFDRGYKPRTRRLSDAEIAAVLSMLDPKPRAVVAWILATGSDTGDVLRAEKGDVDWARGLVRVRGTKTYYRDRLVPITALTRPLLKIACQLGPPFAFRDRLRFETIAGRLGIPHFTPKDLRRTHGWRLRDAGVAPQLIGRVLGHADSAMADRVYAQGDELALARLVRKAVRERPRAPQKRAQGGRR